MCGFHGGEYVECCPLGYRNPIFTSQETHYFSVTEASLLFLCKIWGFHGGDCGAIVTMDISEERSASIIIVTRISELGRTFAARVGC
jgi:hypothetical protein